MDLKWVSSKLIQNANFLTLLMVVYVTILQISGIYMTNTCIYYQTHTTLVTDVVSRGRITVQLTRKILVQK